MHRGRPCKCKTCARVCFGVGGEAFCPAINARVDPEASQACGGASYVKSGNRVMVRRKTSQEISRINSANARKVRNHNGGRKKIAPELLMEKTTSVNARISDAKTIREWAEENGTSVVEMMHRLVEYGRNEFDY